MSDTYRDCLRQYGLKSTKARNRVLDVLSHKTGVMTVEAVYAELLEGGDKVSFSTVYRILEMFTKRGLTEKMFLPDEGKIRLFFAAAGAYPPFNLFTVPIRSSICRTARSMTTNGKVEKKRPTLISSATISNSTGTVLPAKKMLPPSER